MQIRLPFRVKPEEDALSIGEAFEFLLAEWHITPEYIMDNWTDEMFELMCEKLVERKKREAEAFKGRSSTLSKTQKVSDTELFARAGHLIKVVKHGG